MFAIVVAIFAFRFGQPAICYSCRICAFVCVLLLHPCFSLSQNQQCRIGRVRFQGALVLPRDSVHALVALHGNGNDSGNARSNGSGNALSSTSGSGGGSGGVPLFETEVAAVVQRPLEECYVAYAKEHPSVRAVFNRAH